MILTLIVSVLTAVIWLQAVQRYDLPLWYEWGALPLGCATCALLFGLGRWVETGRVEP